MQAVLEVTTGPHTGRRLTLSPGIPLRIGRTTKSDYVVAEDTFLSGAHFYVEWSGDACIVRDLNSSNGTFLNGTRTSEAALHEGDIITAGQSSFAFHFEQSADGALPSLDETRPMPASLLGGPPRQAPEAPAPPSAPAMPPWAPTSYGAPVEPSGFPAGAPPLPSAPLPPPPLNLPTSLTPEPPPAPPLSPSQNAMLDVLRGLADPVYAIVDGSAASTFVEAVKMNGGTVEVLSDVSRAAMTVLNPESPAAAQFAADVWGRGSAILVMSRQPAVILRNHLRRFQTMLSSDGVEFQFRSFNPALMRAFLATLNGEEAKAFFGPAGAMLMEGSNADELVLFMPGPGGTLQKVMPLGSDSARA